MELPVTTLSQDEPIQVLQSSFSPIPEQQPLQTTFTDSSYIKRSENYNISQNETQIQCQIFDKSDFIEEIKPLKESEIVKLNAWRNDCKYGDFVEGTMILPCKAFLANKKWHPYLALSERFDLIDLVEDMNKKNLKIGLIIDLNRSFDYYNFDEIKKTCALLSEASYMKIMMENAAVPSDEVVDQVFAMLKDAHEQKKVVAIHCFNGVNRTGYIIADFLCRYYGLSGKEAVMRFETARNHRIEHECMIEKLEAKYPSSSNLSMPLKSV